MRTTNCNTRLECAFISLAASILAGIVAAIAQFTAIITLTTVFYIVAFGIAILFLVTLLALTPVLYRIVCQGCLGSNIRLTTAGIVGTLVTSIILISIGFAATSVSGAIFVGLLAAFFTLTVTSVVCTVNCASRYEYRDNI